MLQNKFQIHYRRLQGSKRSTPCYFPSPGFFHPPPYSLHSSHSASLAGLPLGPSYLLLPLPGPLFPRKSNLSPQYSCLNVNLSLTLFWKNFSKIAPPFIFVPFNSYYYLTYIIICLLVYVVSPDMIQNIGIFL